MRIGTHGKQETEGMKLTCRDVCQEQCRIIFTITEQMRQRDSSVTVLTAEFPPPAWDVEIMFLCGFLSETHHINI